MKAKPIDIVFSVGLGLLAIYAVHSFLLVDSCLDRGGAISQDSGECIGINEQNMNIAFSGVLLTIYFFIGLSVSLVSAFILNKVRGLQCG